MNNPFKSLSGFSLSGLFSKSGGSVLGVDVGSSSIKVVQLRREGGRAILETYGELALGPYAKQDVGTAVRLSIDKTAEALVDIMREAKVSTFDAGIAIPISSSLVTLIEMPLVDEKQFAEMVPLEARKYVPVPISEVLMDWWVIPKTDSNTSYPFGGDDEKDVKRGKMVDVLLAVIHNESVSNYQEVAKQANLKLGFYEIEIFSTIRSVLDNEVDTTMIVDMGATSMKLYIVEKGIVRNSHVINKGGQDLTRAISRTINTSVQEAERLKRHVGLSGDMGRADTKEVVSTTLSYAFSEANRVMINYEKRTGKNIKKVVLTGGGALLSGLLPFTKSFFETDVFMADPFSKVDTPAFLENVLKRTGPEFAVAIGVALRKLQEMK